MIDPTYTVQALAWTAVWSGAGLYARQWMAGKAEEQRRRERHQQTRTGSAQ